MGTGPIYENERTPDMPEWNNPQEVLRFASRLTGLSLDPAVTVSGEFYSGGKAVQRVTLERHDASSAICLHLPAADVGAIVREEDKEAILQDFTDDELGLAVFRSLVERSDSEFREAIDEYSERHSLSAGVVIIRHGALHVVQALVGSQSFLRVRASLTDAELDYYRLLMSLNLPICALRTHGLAEADFGGALQFPERRWRDPFHVDVPDELGCADSPEPVEEETDSNSYHQPRYLVPDNNEGKSSLKDFLLEHGVARRSPQIQLLRQAAFVDRHNRVELVLAVDAAWCANRQKLGIEQSVSSLRLELEDLSTRVLVKDSMPLSQWLRIHQRELPVTVALSRDKIETIQGLFFDLVFEGSPVSEEGELQNERAIVQGHLLGLLAHPAYRGLFALPRSANR